MTDSCFPYASRVEAGQRLSLQSIAAQERADGLETKNRPRYVSMFSDGDHEPQLYVRG